MSATSSVDSCDVKRTTQHCRPGMLLAEDDSQRQPIVNIIDRAVGNWVATNIAAGSDTTAIILRAVFYNLLKHPSTLRKLREELKASQEAGKLSNPVNWQECQSLRYLDACIKEAERVHPAVGLPLERVVPPEGSNICGRYLKGGTIVGINAWVVNQDQEVFGADAGDWRPDRWLCEPTRRTRMEQALFTVRSHGTLRLEIVWLTLVTI